jgi:hypothetical protein
MIDMPAALANVQNIDWGRVQDAVADYGPAIDIIKKTWSRESLLDIMNGHIAVPDDVINEAIANRLPADGSVKSLQVTSKSNGRLDILADTKKAGRIELSGNIDAFVHDGDQSYMTYHVRERALKDHGLMSWVFSRLSMSMAERLFGRIELSDDLPTRIEGNSITVDFHTLLTQSELGQTSFMGHPLLNMVQVEKAEPHDGYVEFDTALNVPSDVRDALIRILTKE